MKNETLGKIDFHLHSYASNVTDYYTANAFSIPESYSDPIRLYHLLKQRGMSLVTLTDHNSIDGVLEMLDAGFIDVFISAEMTTTFPEDGCNIHITVANMTQAQFREANRLRGNVYEMVHYIDQQIALEHTQPAANKLVYFMTHPLTSTQNRPYGREGALTVDHVEKALLLCNCIEVRNGTRTRAINELTLQIVRTLDRVTIQRLANRHGIEPKGATPWLKAVVGGSDDHSGINPGQTWTEFAFYGNHPRPNCVVDAIRQRRAHPAGAHGGPITLAHSLLKLLYDGSTRRSKARQTKSVSVAGPVLSLLNLVFDSDSRSIGEQLRFRAKLWYYSAFGLGSAARGATPQFEAILEREIYALLADAGFRADLKTSQRADDRIYLVTGTLVNRIFVRYLDRLRSSEGLNLVSAIREVVAMFSSNIFVSLPYLVSFLQQSADSLIAGDARKSFRIAAPQKVVLVTDTFFETNGVSASIIRMIRESIRRNIEFTVVTCVGAEEYDAHRADPEIRHFIDTGHLKLFTSLASLDFPEYDGLKIHFPPLLDLLIYLQESGFTKMQISTPGTVGLVGLLAAKLLQMETAATYHTSIPEYVENYTKDYSLEAMTWKYVILFYHSMDEVLVPSRFIAKLLHKRGLRNRKLLILDRWVDVERFHPSKRTAGYWSRFGVENEQALTKFVYVGRVAVEKNLDLMAKAYRKLRETRQDVHLIVIGDGPYRRALETQLAGLPVTFTGFIGGDELARAIASADVKLFPSTTDTWGNAPLEAQASGLPVVVSDVGGPAELMINGITGIRVAGHDVQALYDAMVTLMDRETRVRMGRGAREFAEVNRVDEPFTAVFDSDGYRRRLQSEGQSTERDGVTLSARMAALADARMDIEGIAA